MSFSISCTAPPQAPTVTAGSDQHELEGLLISLTGASFSDPDNDGPWDYIIDWGDGTRTTGTAPNPGSIGGTHTYITLVNTDFRVTVTVTDQHGLSGQASKVIHVTLL